MDIARSEIGTKTLTGRCRRSSDQHAEAAKPSPENVFAGRSTVSYLQTPPSGNTDLEQRTKELRSLLREFKANPSLLSGDDANGWVEPGLPPGQVRAGVLAVGGTTADVTLVRVVDPASGKIWLISNDTVARIPKLYAQMESEAPTWAYTRPRLSWSLSWPHRPRHYQGCHQLQLGNPMALFVKICSVIEGA
jgi:hypothetical protein